MKCSLTALIQSGLNRRVPATGLSLFRVFFGMVALQEIIFLFHFRHLIFDKTPYLDPASPIVSLSLVAWSASAFFLMIGLFTRASAIANYSFWVLFLALTPMWHDFDGGFDQLMICSSFLLIFANSERRFSFDNLLLRIRFQTRFGAAGTSRAIVPSGASASLTAHITAAGVVWIAPSPQPLAPNGVKGEGVTTSAISVGGTSLMVGIR